MRFRFLILLTLVLVISTSCSYEATRKTETAVEQSVEKFHRQLNEQQYHDIYAESDVELRSRITEVEFTAQLLNTHEQMGTISGKAFVHIDDSVGRALKRTFSGGWEKVRHRGLASSDSAFANEMFVWSVENDLPKLVSYESKLICNKPCSLGISIP
jgi:hypothetical protein